MNSLLDTNFIINYFKGTFKGASGTFADSIINQKTYISVITQIELLSWKLLNDKDEEIIKGFISDCTVFSLEESIVSTTILLRKAISIKLPDAIIAATALEHNMQLLTHNSKDFKNIQGLILVDANAL